MGHSSIPWYPGFRRAVHGPPRRSPGSGSDSGTRPGEWMVFMDVDFHGLSMPSGGRIFSTSLLLETGMGRKLERKKNGIASGFLAGETGYFYFSTSGCTASGTCIMREATGNDGGAGGGGSGNSPWAPDFAPGDGRIFGICRAWRSPGTGIFPSSGTLRTRRGHRNRRSSRCQRTVQKAEKGVKTPPAAMVFGEYSRALKMFFSECKGNVKTKKGGKILWSKNKKLRRSL